MKPPPNINMFVAGLLVDELVRRGITLFCLSPGSRSAPLVAAAAGHPGVQIQVCHDERAAGFYAVGYARGSGQAGALVCTSGTAGANYFPAVIEAFQARLPLVVLTADRPEELQNRGANQTINQEGMFGRFVSWSMTMASPGVDFDPVEFLRKLDELFKADSALPLHINCRFREPLAPSEQDYDYQRLREAVHSAPRTVDVAEDISERDISADVNRAVDLLNNKKRGIIVAGPEAPFRATDGLGRLADALDWPIIADVLSQQRRKSEKTTTLYDLYLESDRVADDLRPDMVIHFGGLPTSKHLNRFLLRHRGVDYLKIQNHQRTIDPDHLETERIIADPDHFITTILPYLQDCPTTGYADRWGRYEEATGRYLGEYFSDEHLTEPALYARLNRILPDNEALFLSSSMPVRDADAFMTLSPVIGPVGANRGASGIDGIIASACGFARGCRRATTLVIGDLAVIHDLNSLALVAGSEYPVTIIAINNNGGGIFHFLPIVDHGDIFEPYFGVPHGLTFDTAAKMFNLPYAGISSAADLEASYNNFHAGGRSALMEMTCDRDNNLDEHKSVRKHVRQIFEQEG